LFSFPQTLYTGLWYSQLVEHELSFFLLDEETGKYERFDELHFQRTYTIEQYSCWLLEMGFDLLEVSADFEESEPHSQSERIFFVARKQREAI